MTQTRSKFSIASTVSRIQLTKYSQLVIALILSIVFISAGSILWNTYTIAKREAKSVRTAAFEYAETLANTLKEPLWDVDRENVTTLCRFYLENELVSSVKLVGVSGEIFIDETAPSREQKSETITHTKEIRHKGELLGNLTIVVDAAKADLLNRQMWHAFIITALILLLTLVVLWLMRGRTRVAMEMAELNANLINEIEHRKQAEDEQRRLIEQLQEALIEVKQLSGLLPICANCKKIRNDEGYWSQVEEYITENTDVRFSHSICPDCIKTLYPDYVLPKLK